MITQEDDPAGASSDTHDGLLVDATPTTMKKLDEVDMVAAVDERLPDTPRDDEPKDHGSSAESSRVPSFSPADHASEVGSIRSMPAVRVSESPTPIANGRTSPLPSPAASSSSHRPPPSPARSQTLQEPSGSSLQTPRKSRHRSVMLEGRSANRLSGFFNNLMHRREPLAQGPREAAQEPSNSQNQSRNQSAPASEAPSRPASPPPPPPRPVTPPPCLPPPTLTELGLSLSTLTSDLSPSHFTAPPTSGAFLAPHYLLLCHAQGLDVLPLVSPPAPQPYALVRRVSFKSVVVMEQRGVLVAIAGRRDGVRVYALEEVKKAIEWRIDVEIKRERERLRRETLKKPATIRTVDGLDLREASEKPAKASLSTPPPGETPLRRMSILRKSSHGTIPPSPPPPVPLIPRSPIARPPRPKPRSNSVQVPNHNSEPPRLPDFLDHPPPYVHSEASSSQLNIRSQPSVVSLRARSPGNPVNNVLSGRPRLRTADSKVDEWAESSEDEAIDIVAAGASGSQALDERTSATLSANRPNSGIATVLSQASVPTRNRSSTLRRNRPSNLDLTLAIPSVPIPPPEPSPVPTLLSLRQALAHSPVATEQPPLPTSANSINVAEEDDEDETDGRISLAQALLESRLPDIPPLGTSQPQQPILLSNRADTPPVSPSATISSRQRPGSTEPPPSTTSRRRRRRWSVLMNGPSNEAEQEVDNAPRTAPATEGSSYRFMRSQSFRSNRSQPSISSTVDTAPITPTPPTAETGDLQVYRQSRFLPRFIYVFNNRRSEERARTPVSASDTEASKPPVILSTPQAPPPKLEYVKLPGTKGSLMIKAVETAKKSFLAILCGDNGEKVELFAGTYRTALGLSRTFILPDSPRSLELQLQGDDLVEVFLVFAQNVFGLEPATVRVREVRIGRAERRAARRRAREREATSGGVDAEAQDEETNVNVTVGISVAEQNGDGPAGLPRPSSPTLVAAEHPSAQSDRPSTPVDGPLNPDELLAVIPPSVGPYSTFQQLSFAPKFPLASIADDYIIPPTYPSFVQYRQEYEPEETTEESQPTEEPPSSSTEFSPPGLPVPTPTEPSQWYYRDPKGVVHGPWKSALMQAWYNQRLLPPDLPVRRAEDEEYTLLKELRLQSVDPTQPFTPPSPPPARSPPVVATPEEKQDPPLLSPISLLAQPRHFGPPALFFSSRGGHSTTIVDSRGRSVLKGKFVWTSDEPSESSQSTTKMGDIKRLEAFDIEDRSVLVAMRQGGLEAVDLSDALLKPADESRTILPHYNPPINTTNRRPPFVWKIGTPITASPTPFNALTNKSKSTFVNLSGKKSSTGPSKSTGGKSDAGNDLIDLEPTDEVFFIGRKQDEMYVCERNAGSFRILRLAPQQ